MFPDSSRNYNIEIKRTRVLQRKSRGIYRHNFRYQEKWERRKMLNENHNRRILILITHGKIIAGRPTQNILYKQRETQRSSAKIINP